MAASMADVNRRLNNVRRRVHRIDKAFRADPPPSEARQTELLERCDSILNELAVIKAEVES